MMAQNGVYANIASTAYGIAAIESPELLHIKSGRGISYGAHQVWYQSWMQRMGGCGPTAASNLLWYLAATRPDTCANLFEGNATSQPEMARLMEAVWRYVKPGMRGVDKASILTDGALRYAQERGVALNARILELPPRHQLDDKTVYRFLANAFSDNLPIAFLNLSNGAVRNLDNWHWVTLISIDNRLQAEMYDQSRRQSIDLELWLRTTTGGGAFAALKPACDNK